MNTTHKTLLLLSFLPLAAPAHHSRMEFSRNEIREIEGEVVSVFWRNPHVHVRVRGQDGTLWDLEGADIVTLDRRGLPRDVVEAGDWVRAAGFTSTRRDNFLDITNVLLPSGTEAVFSRLSEPRWSDNFVGQAPAADPTAPDASLAAAASERGIFRTWHRTRINIPELSDLPLTEEALNYHAAYEPLADDPLLSCTTPGMPRAMTFAGPHPIEFFEGENEIALRMEYMNIDRVIHMEPASDPARQPVSPLGYSVGRWDGDDLVVTTTRIDWPHFDLNPPLIGFPQSEAAEMTERFALGAGGNELTYDITIADPATFTEPLILDDYLVWRWDPNVLREPFVCEVNESLTPDP